MYCAVSSAEKAKVVVMNAANMYETVAILGNSNINSEDSTSYTRLAFSPDGSLLAGVTSTRCTVWDIPSNSTVYDTHFPFTQNTILLSFVSGGAELAVCSLHGTVKLLETTTWSEKRKVRIQSDYIGYNKVGISVDGHTIVYRVGSTTLAYWTEWGSLRKPSSTTKLDIPVSKLSNILLNRFGDKVAVLDQDTVTIFDVFPSGLRYLTRLPNLYACLVQFDNTGYLLQCLLHDDCKYSVFDVANGVKLWEVNLSGMARRTSAACTRDHIATFGYGEPTRVVEGSSGVVLHDLTDLGCLQCVCYSEAMAILL
jgi:hypothetical protein